MVMGLIVILIDFFTTALPNTVEITSRRITKLTKRTKKMTINRKTVVAPFFGDVLGSMPDQGDSNAPDLSSNILPNLAPIVESSESASSMSIQSSGGVPSSGGVSGSGMLQTSHGHQRFLAEPATLIRDADPVITPESTVAIVNAGEKLSEGALLAETPAIAPGGLFTFAIGGSATETPSSTETPSKKAVIHRKTVEAPFVGAMIGSAPGQGSSVASDPSCNLAPSPVPIVGSESASSVPILSSSSSSAPSSCGIPGPRMSQRRLSVQQEGTVSYRGPARLVRTSTARKVDDFF